MMPKRAALAGILSALALAAPASADPGNGAQHVHYSSCDGFFCAEGDQLTNYTENKNNYALFIHEETHVTYNDPNCRTSSDGEQKLFYHVKKESGELQVYHFKGQSVSIFLSCFGQPAQRCTATGHFQLANGEVKYNRTEYVCTSL